MTEPDDDLAFLLDSIEDDLRATLAQLLAIPTDERTAGERHAVLTTTYVFEQLEAIEADPA